MKPFRSSGDDPFDVLSADRIQLRRAGVTERRLQWVGILISVLLVLYYSNPLAAVVAVEVLVWSASRGVWRDTMGHTGAVLAAGVVSVITGFGVFEPVAEGDALYTGIFSAYMVASICIAVGFGAASAVLHNVTDQAAGAAAVARAVTARHERAAVIGLDPQGRIAFFSRGAEVLLGYKPSDIIGDSVSTLVPAATLSRLASDLATEDGGKPLSRLQASQVSFLDLVNKLAVEENAEPEQASRSARLWELRRADGETRDHLLSVTVLRDADKQPRAYLLTSEDVTRQARTHDVMLSALLNERESADLLHEADRVKRDLVATVSHELRTPATSIMGYSELLAEGAFGDLDPAAKDAVERVLGNGQRLLALVEDLLELSRVEEKGTNRPAVPVDMAKVLRSAHDVIAPLADARHQELRCMQPSEGVWVAGDPADLERVLLNLLSNAVKFTPESGRIGLDLMVRADDVVVTVSDTGAGISEEEQAHLFDAFFRSESATRDAVQGTGLGLTIAKSTVDSHGGELSVSSVPGEGTTFTVVLPKLPAGQVPNH